MTTAVSPSTTSATGPIAVPNATAAGLDHPTTISADKLEDLLDQFWSDPGQKSDRPRPPKLPEAMPGLPAAVAASKASLAPHEFKATGDVFMPPEPATLAEAGLDETEVSHLILKVLLQHGVASGARIAAQIKLPFHLVSELLGQMKKEHRVVYKNTAGVDDFQCELTMQGLEQARRWHEHSAYCGAAPVTLGDYIASVRAQSITLERPTVADMQRAFCDLVVEPEIVVRLAQALRAGRGLFLHGPAGNGKTCFAERMTLAYGEHIWIPRAVSVDREIVRLYDTCCHEELPLKTGPAPVRHDTRWIRIRRPTVVAGGELTMDRLEVTLNKQIGVCEAPLQMKSNCGTLVIDDFGRQRMNITELLNRWIVPLEKRYDYVNLPSGRTVQLPFDQLVVFSTNLEPRSLADEAFLRRIPYKIDVQDPREDEFRELFRRSAAMLKLLPADGVVDYLIEKHYRQAGRHFRRCHPRDLLDQVRHYCEVRDLPLTVTCESLDLAVVNYFSMMG
jgi:hypothetical protein